MVKLTKTVNPAPNSSKCDEVSRIVASMIKFKRSWCNLEECAYSKAWFIEEQKGSEGGL